MSRAVIVPFFYDGSYPVQTHKVLSELFSRHVQLWYPVVDRIYVIDSGWGFDGIEQLD